MSNLLEKLLGASKKKVEANHESMQAQIKEQLKGIVYDDELVEELTPVFMKLQGAEGFNKVVELLITKEKQIEAISGGDWFKKDSNPESKKEPVTEEKQDTGNLVDEILKSKYSKGNQ